MKTWIFFLFSLYFLFGVSFNLQSQVTVGSGEAPEKYSLFQVKDKTHVSGDPEGGATALKGGLLLPRVELVERNELLPFVQVSDIGTPDYENIQKPAHSGLIVYNLKEIPEEDLFIGLNEWDGEKWNALQSKLGNAVGTLGQCDSIIVTGVYKTGSPLTQNNYITIPINVSKAGAYSIVVKPVTNNGFYFSTSGTFMATGYYYIMVPGIGSPINYSTTATGNPMEITFNEQKMNACTPYVYVDDSSKKPIYTMQCSRTSLSGSYSIDTPLDPSYNFITMWLDVHPDAEGSFYSIETDEVDGIKFSGSGYLQKGLGPIRLEGSGTPTSVGEKTFTIKSNSVSNSSTCQAKLIVPYKNKTILSLGYNDYIFGINSPTSQVYKLAHNKLAFGTQSDSKVSIDGFTIKTAGAVTGPTNAELSSALAAKPDIVILTFDVYITASQAQMYANYLNEGGVILAYDEGNSNAVQNLMKAIFPAQAGGISQKRINAAGGVYQLSNIDDEILNGPFGDIRSKHWGDDRSQAAGVTGLPTEQIDIYSNGITLSGLNDGNANQVTAFKHKSLNFIWVADGGFMANIPGSVAPTEGPFKLDSSGLPAPYLNYGVTTKYDVYNSTFYANALAWAIKKATQNGINVPKP